MSDPIELPDPDKVTPEVRRRAADHARSALAETAIAKTQTARRLIIIVTVLSLLLAAAIMAGFLVWRATDQELGQALKEQTALREDAAREQAANARRDAALRSDFEEQTARCAKAKDCTPVKPTAPLPPSVVTGVTLTEVREVVDARLTAAKISLSPSQMSSLARAAAALIPAPAPGVSPSSEQIETVVGAAVSRAIASLPAPEDGVDGAPPSNDQIVAAVAAMCAENACVGADGKDGSPGKAGRGIDSMLVGEDGHLHVTYTDGVVVDQGRIVGEDAYPITFDFQFPLNGGQTASVSCNLPEPESPQTCETTVTNREETP